MLRFYAKYLRLVRDCYPQGEAYRFIANSCALEDSMPRFRYEQSVEVTRDLQRKQCQCSGLHAIPD